MSLKRRSERDVTILIQAEGTRCPGLGSDSRPCGKIGCVYLRRIHNAEVCLVERRIWREEFVFEYEKKALSLYIYNFGKNPL